MEGQEATLKDKDKTNPGRGVGVLGEPRFSRNPWIYPSPFSGKASFFGDRNTFFSKERVLSNPGRGALSLTSTIFSQGVRLYLTHKEAQGLTNRRLSKLYGMFRTFQKYGFEPETSPIQDMALWIQNRPCAQWTKFDYLRLLKEFYQFMGKQNETAWIKPKAPRPKFLKPDEILNWWDILTMTRFTREPRIRALIALLYDSGCRIGEILSYRGSKGIEYKDIYRDEHGARIYVEGKTGPRLLRLQRSFPLLLEYLPFAPTKEPLFYGTYEAYEKSTHRLAKIACINKPINFHNFRKSRATELANYLSPSQLCKHFGWVQGSRELQTYVHTTDQQVDNAILGIADKRTMTRNSYEQF